MIFFAGSFNPFTKGHADILNRLLAIGADVIIGVGTNFDKPNSIEQARTNVKEIEIFLLTNKLTDRVKVRAYGGLTAEEALKCGCNCLARGVRNSTDFDYEYSLAAANRDAFGIETLLIPSDPSLSFISSSLIRELAEHGKIQLAKKYKA